MAGETLALRMLIRRGTAADIPDLMALERQALTAAHWSPEQYQTVFLGEAPSRALLVVESDGGIQGFIAGRILDKEWEIENVVVAKSARRRSLGSQLLQEFVALARERGGEKIFLEVRESNLGARRLYEKLSFSKSGRRRLYYREPQEDAIVYQLGLV
jgi:ribosomal-protein-alanine N-acetyltransferase